MRNITLLVPDTCAIATITLMDVTTDGQVEVMCTPMNFNENTVYNFIKPKSEAPAGEPATVDNTVEQPTDNVEASAGEPADAE